VRGDQAGDAPAIRADRVTPDAPATARTQPVDRRYEPVLEPVRDRLADRIEDRVWTLGAKLGRLVPDSVAERARPMLDRLAALDERLFPTPVYEPILTELPEHLVAPPGLDRDQRLELDQRQLAELQQSAPLRDFAMRQFKMHRSPVPAGMCITSIADLDDWSNANKLPEDPTRNMLFVHGETNLVKCGDVVLDPAGLAEVIRTADLPPDRLLRLVACDAGKGDGCFAQLLADELGVPVEAPTERAWIVAGELFVASVGHRDATGVGIATVPHDGDWKVFQPRTRDEPTGLRAVAARLRR
jgi:hypothetical protein